MVAAAAVSGAVMAPGIEFAAGVDVYFDRSDPLQGEVDAIADRFVNDDLLFVVYESPDVFAHDSLVALRRLGAEIEAVEVPAAAASGAAKTVGAVADVHSLATVDDLVGSSFSFRSEPLVPDPVPVELESLERSRERARANPIVVKTLLGQRDNAAVMVVRLEPSLVGAEKAAAVTAIRGLLAAATTRVKETRYQLVGMAVTEHDLVSYQQEDLARFVPIVTVLMAFMLFFFLRRARGVLVAMAGLGVCLAAAMAVLGVMAGSFNNTSVMIPPLIMALSVAMLIHLFAEYGRHDGGDARREAPQLTLEDLLVPLFMAAITTAVGFYGLRVSEIPAIRGFGEVAAVAMLVAAVLVTAVAAIAFRRWSPAELVSPRGFAFSTGLNGSLTWLAAAVIRRRYVIFATCVLVTVAFAAGISRITADQTDLMFFDRDTPLRQANTTMEAEIGGSTTVVSVIAAPQGHTFVEPAQLAKLEALSTFLVADLGVDSTVSVADLIRLMHREFFNGDPAEHRLPDTGEQVAQLLLLNTDTTIDEYLDESRRWVRVVARTPEHGSAKLMALYGRLDRFLREQFPASEGYEAHAAANSRLTAAMVDNLVSSQARSLGISTLVIFALMLLMLRSLRLGLHSIAPNVVPIVVNLGLMGWLGIELNAATVMISTVALGIAVDDTVHFLQCLKGRLAVHGDLERGIRETIRTKGPAIIGTSVVISAGFAVMLASNFGPTRDFALLMCITMGAAIVGDLVVLPAFLLVVRHPLAQPRRVPQIARSQSHHEESNEYESDPNGDLRPVGVECVQHGAGR